MRLRHLRVQNFRNIEFAELDLSSERIFLLGANGQGKSNLLEALGLLMALRSFRTQRMLALPRLGSDGFSAVYELDQDIEGQVEVEIYGSSSGRRALVDGENISRLSDFIGRFPVLPFSSGDLMLLRGSPVERRRFLDLTLSVMDRSYYHDLRNYNRGIARRNYLLKNSGSAVELSAFETEIAVKAVSLVDKRNAGLEKLRRALVFAYTGIAELDEGPELEFRPNALCENVESISRLLHDSRARDTIIGSTQRGPHRDDFHLSLNIGGAKEYASDGQQRGLCIALRIAQAQLLQEALGLTPVLLADDVLGELDSHRQAGFWRTCPPEFQIIATGTDLPNSDEDWQVWKVAAGRFERFGQK